MKNDTSISDHTTLYRPNHQHKLFEEDICSHFLAHGVAAYNEPVLSDALYTVILPASVFIQSAVASTTGHGVMWSIDRE